LSTPNLYVSPFATQRRSQRILLAVRVEVSGWMESGATFQENTSTIIVNAHGAMIQLRQIVHKGQLVTLQNQVTTEAVECTVVDVTMGSSGEPEVGIEFVEPSPRFWRVSFPPADWSPRSAEAKRFSPATAAAPKAVTPPPTKK